MKIYNALCDYMKNPVGYDFQNPTFSWQATAEDGSRQQTAYQIVVAADPLFLRVIDDTGRVASSRMTHEYAGSAFLSRTRYYWRVRIWNERGNASEWSSINIFETAKYEEPWRAEWIGWEREYPQLRKRFRVRDNLVAARAYACGVGLYEMFINSKRVGDEYLAPGFTVYDSYLPYQTYDISNSLRTGDNMIGCRLGNGYYKGRISWPEIREQMGDRYNIFGNELAFLCEIHLLYEDGSEEIVSTDEQWEAAQSPYLRAEIYDGEVFDARMQDDLWCDPSSKYSEWDHAKRVSIDQSLLTARKNIPVRIMEIIKPVKTIHTPAGEWVIDFGQNFAGWIRAEIDAPLGTEILFQYGEALDRYGNFYRENMRTALAETRYIADGTARAYRPAFTYYGFRYVKVSGLPGTGCPDIRRFIGEAVYSDMARIGDFECSDSRVNRLFQNALWGQKSNFVDIPTDCPQRDERMGWTGDAQVFCATASMNMHTDAFYRKYLVDLAFEQAKDNYVPVTVPNYLRKTGIWQIPTTGWSDAAVIMPWTLYTHYDDTAVVRRQYSSMRDWVEYMRRQDTLGVDRYYGFHLGDWLAQDTKDPDNFFGLTPPDLIATAFYAHSAKLLSKAAVILGKTEDAYEYAALSERVRNAFRKEYVSENGRVVSETQTAYAIALYMDMLLPGQKTVAAAHLKERLQIDHVRLTTGFLGTPYLCPALSENGLNEYAYALLLQTKYPSWLYEVEMGATTVWERWNSIREDSSFGPVGMNSLNHYAFGAIVEWLYRYAAGINPCESAPGFHKVVLKPLPNSQLKHVKASIQTQYGLIQSQWRLEGTQIQLSFAIPFNVSAEIHLPDADGCEITENGIPISETVFTRGMGTWRYEYTPNGQTIHKRVTTPIKPKI